MRRGERGQVSLEYTLLLAFTFAILVPGIYFFYSYVLSTSSGADSGQYGKLGAEMISTALQSFGQGEGSWLTLSAALPASVRNITIGDSGRELVIFYETGSGVSEVVFYSDTLLSNSTESRKDGSIFRLEPHAGTIDIRFTAIDDFVAVEERFT